MLQGHRRPLASLLTASVLALGAAAPAAQASEVVKLARLVLTGKWSSGAPAPEAKPPAPEKPEASADPAPVHGGPSASVSASVEVLAAHRPRTVL